MIKFFPSLITISLLCVSCQKSDDISTEILSNDAYEMRSELKTKVMLNQSLILLSKQECFLMSGIKQF